MITIKRFGVNPWQIAIHDGVIDINDKNAPEGYMGTTHIQIRQDMWRECAHIILESYLKQRKLKRLGISAVYNKDLNRVEVRGIGVGININCSNINDWIKNFIYIMERHDNVKIQDSVLR